MDWLKSIRIWWFSSSFFSSISLTFFLLWHWKTSNLVEQAIENTVKYKYEIAQLPLLPTWLSLCFTLNNTKLISCFHVWQWKYSSGQVDFPFLNYVVKRKRRYKFKARQNYWVIKSIKIILFIVLNVDLWLLTMFSFFFCFLFCFSWFFLSYFFWVWEFGIRLSRIPNSVTDLNFGLYYLLASAASSQLKLWFRLFLRYCVGSELCAELYIHRKMLLC